MTHEQAFALAQKLWGEFAGAWDLGMPEGVEPDEEQPGRFLIDMGDHVTDWERYRVGEALTHPRAPAVLMGVGQAPMRAEYGYGGGTWEEAFRGAAWRFSSPERQAEEMARIEAALSEGQLEG